MKIRSIAAATVVVLATAASAQTADPVGALAGQAHRARRAETEAPLNRVIKPLNDGAEFQLICRGGPGWRARLSNIIAPEQPSFPSEIGGGDRGTRGSYFFWSITFIQSSLPPDHSGRNLQPGQCSPADFPLGGRDPAALQARRFSEIYDNYGAGDSVLFDTLVDYLLNPSNSLSFTVIEEAQDTGERFLEVTRARHWKPEFYTGPLTGPTPAKTANDAIFRSQLPGAKPLGRVTLAKPLGRAPLPPGATPATSLSVCDAARAARARNSPAAPGLEARCRAVGEAAPPARPPAAVDDGAPQPPDPDPNPPPPDMP